MAAADGAADHWRRRREELVGLSMVLSPSTLAARDVAVGFRRARSLRRRFHAAVLAIKVAAASRDATQKAAPHEITCYFRCRWRALMVSGAWPARLGTRPAGHDGDDAAARRAS